MLLAFARPPREILVLWLVVALIVGVAGGGLIVYILVSKKVVPLWVALAGMAAILVLGFAVLCGCLGLASLNTNPHDGFGLPLP
jgi:hypothetical protein